MLRGARPADIPPSAGGGAPRRAPASRCSPRGRSEHRTARTLLGAARRPRPGAAAACVRRRGPLFARPAGGSRDRRRRARPGSLPGALATLIGDRDSDRAAHGLAARHFSPGQAGPHDGREAVAPPGQPHSDAPPRLPRHSRRHSPSSSCGPGDGTATTRGDWRSLFERIRRARQSFEAETGIEAPPPAEAAPPRRRRRRRGGRRRTGPAADSR